MKIAIIGGSPHDYDVLDQKLNELIAASQTYLFYVVCGGLALSPRQPSLGEIWAKKNGAPIWWIEKDDIQSLLNGVAAAADYIIFIFKGEQWMKNFIMQFRMTGKHGTVIRLE